MILLYHKIHPDSQTMWWVTVNSFYRQMSELQSKEVVYLDDYDCKNPKHVVITFDGIYENVCEFALPVLKHFNYPFELFITSDYVGQDNKFDHVEPLTLFASKEGLLELVQNGGRLQWHTKSHPNLKDVHHIESIIGELSVPEYLLAMDSKGFKWFAYPYGAYNDVVVKEVKKRFNGALSCDQGNEFDPYIFNRTTVVNDTQFRKQKIACIIVSYNYGQYLIEAIESVLRQTILPDEILISDDFSVDDTPFIAESYAKRFPDLIRYNRNEKNLGIVVHFNKAITMTNCDYVMFLGADNRLVSNYIEECAKILDEKETIGIAYTDFVLFGNRAKVVYSSNYGGYPGKVIQHSFFQVNFPEFNTRKEMLQHIYKSNFIHGSSMFKKEAFNKVGGYMQSEAAEDHNLFTRIIASGYEAKKATKAYLEYRQHSIDQANNMIYLHNLLNLYKKLNVEKNNFEKSRIYTLGHKLFKAKNMHLKKLLKAIFKKKGK